ncbi:MAG: ATP-dependent helicase HrpB [Bermanella sp.]
MTELPIHAILPEVTAHLAQHSRLIVQAPPGAGKSTALPLALLDAHPHKHGQIWLLEPRRLAAQQVAKRLAQTLGEEVGHSIGLMTGDSSRISQHNRIVVMTEAILSQRLVNENDIPDCSMLIFDEFHERNLQTDLGLALALQCQEYLRDDLKLVIMSATLDTQDLATQLDCSIINSEGKSYQVTNVYLPPAINQHNPLATQVKSAINLAFQDAIHGHGDVLVFLPGVKEIQQCLRVLTDTFESDIANQRLAIHPLHGQLNPEQQNKVFTSNKQRNIILATDIAKTSLTLPKVTIVIDSGLERINQFNLRMGMDELITVNASQASAIQRAGRAGRVQAGLCYRLYSEEEFKRRSAFSPHAIERSDLASLSLTLAAWGSLDLSDYTFLTQPDKQSFLNSIQLLDQLNILNEKKLTPHGKVISALGLHPRLSHMILKSKDFKMAYDGCMLAALLSEGDPLFFNEQNSDLSIRLQLFERDTLPSYFEQAKVNIKKSQRIIQLADKFSKMLNITKGKINSLNSGLLLMLAYPDRVAQRRGKGYRLRNGLGCQLHHLDGLTPSDYLAVAHISQSQQQGLHSHSIVRLACKVTLADIEQLFTQQFHSTCTLQLNDKQQLQQINRINLGQLILSETTSKAKPKQKTDFHLQEFSNKGLVFLPLKDEQKALLKRLQLAHDTLPEIFKSFDEADLIDDKENWLTPFLNTSDLNNLDYSQAFLSRLEWPVQQTLNELFPTRFELPTGRHASIDYSQTPPVVKAKLQECFGLAQSPTIAQGKITLNLHLLSPAQRPLAMTQDLAFFWKQAYPEVRKENRGRYAKHPWPEDPLTAEASGLTKKRMSQQ